jgi:hypothetical protein
MDRDTTMLWGRISIALGVSAPVGRGFRHLSRFDGAAAEERARVMGD